MDKMVNYVLIWHYLYAFNSSTHVGSVIMYVAYFSTVWSSFIFRVVLFVYCVAATGVTPAIYSVLHSTLCAGVLYIIGYGALLDFEVNIKIKNCLPVNFVCSI